MKVYILREEDLYSRDDDSDCNCSNHWNNVSVHTTKQKAEAAEQAIRDTYKKMGFRGGQFFDIQEMEMDNGND